MSPAGGGESAIADLGVEFFRLDFGVCFAAHSVPSQRVGDSDGQTPVSALLKPSHGDCFPQRVGDPDGRPRGD